MNSNNLSIATGNMMRRGGLPVLCGIALLLSCASVGPERPWDNPYDLQGINIVPPPTIKAVFADTVIAINDTLVLAATAIAENDTVKEYRWIFDSSTTVVSSKAGSYPRVWGIADTGKHRIRVLAVNGFDMSSPEAVFSVTVRACPPRIATAVSDTFVAQKSTVEKVFSAADSNGSIVKYLWSTSENGWSDSAAAGASGTGTVTASFSNSGGGRLQIRWAARDDDGLLAFDTFFIRFNRAPDSVWLSKPGRGDTARFLSFDDLTTTGRILCSFSGHDPDGADDSLTYSFWLGSSQNDTVVFYSGKDTSVVAEKIVPLSTYHWRVSAKDQIGDVRTVAGTLVTAPPPATPEGMVKVRSGGKYFQMGQSGFDSAEAPIHTVVFTKNFWIDTAEVTAGMFAAIMGTTAPAGAAANLPVVNVTWFDAALFCNARSKRDGRDTVYVFQSKSSSAGHTTALGGLSVRRNVTGYRLPTEAEWEYANRLDSITLFFWGNDAGVAGEYAWTKENSRNAVHAVAAKKRNLLGLYDMSGNVWEWCDDWFDPRYYATSPGTDPGGPQAGTERVIRGGSWQNSLYFAQAGTRSKVVPQSGTGSIGFRAVLSIQ